MFQTAELGIKDPLEYASAGIGYHPCFFTAYLYDPSWLKITKFSLYLCKTKKLLKNI